MGKKLSELLLEVNVVNKVGDNDPLILAIEFDSRQVNDGGLFVATEGTNVDGHKFIQVSINNGAVAVILEKMPDELNADITYVQVENSSLALGQIASAFYDHPSRRLSLVGVTGTNGKTTIATLLYRISKKLGYKAGLFSTVVNYIDNQKIEATHTTPDSVMLNKLMAEMVKTGCDYCFMEVSSHSVVQERIGGLLFKGAIFTNLTHDHLDYHKTFDSYLQAKKMFFDRLSPDSFALTNLDDKNGMVMVQNSKAKTYNYSIRELADFKAKVIENHFDGMQLEIDGNEIWTPFMGRFNVSNLLAVYGTSILLGHKKDEVLVSLSQLTPVDGRFETILSDNGVVGVVDYAHTPDALKNVIDTINDIRKPGQQLITVVGAGGNRDSAKRPVMAKESVKGSTKVILTSDNPRNEDPDDIIRQMMEGVEFKDRIKVVAITNRKEAIRTACMLAKKGDIILVAGKGHETYQEVKGVKHHFDDREVLREIFEEMNKAQ